MTETSEPTVQPVLSELDEKEMRWFLGERTWLRATATQTGGSIGFVEQVLNAGSGSPYHVHHNEDEYFYVLEGAIRFFTGGQSSVLGPGGFAFLPRDIPHGFRVEGNVQSRVLVLTTPGGFEGFVAEMSTPEPPTGPPDMEALAQTAAEYGIEILGPLPE